MQFGIKSLLGAVVVLAAFVMGVFQFSMEVCVLTLFIAHVLSPAVWVAGCVANHGRGLKTFFLCGLVVGIAPWAGTLYWGIMAGLIDGIDSTNQPWEERLWMLGVWASSGILSIAGGLLGLWVQACCRPAIHADNEASSVLPAVVDPLAPEAKSDR